MELQITCPYCGKFMKLNLTRRQAKDCLCELCGSPLANEVEEAIKNYVPPSHTPARNIPVHTKASVNYPAMEPTNQFPPPTSSSPQKSGSQSNAFPFGINTQSSTNTPFSNNTQRKVKLIFTQINQEIEFPNHKKIIHFGRNTIIPLVSPSKFDIEWLNSISRVQVKNGRVIKTHFSIRRDASGQFFIEDKSSRWGTWLNRKQIKEQGEIPIYNGDKIELMLSKPTTKKVFPFEIQFQCC